MIIGLGSGRCGTASLAKVLDLSHEAISMPWIVSLERYQEAVEHAKRKGGDVGCFWLNYVGLVLDDHPGTKFVCLKRDRAETVESWAARLYDRSSFHISAVARLSEKGVERQSIFPEYGEMPIEQAAGLYYDEYYERAEKLEHELPGRFRIFSMESVLNDADGQRRMLEFCGRPDQEIQLEVRKNDRACILASRDQFKCNKEMLDCEISPETVGILQGGSSAVEEWKRTHGA